MEDFVLTFVLPNLKADAAHSYDHFCKVRDHAREAVAATTLEEWQKEAVVAAAFLHDIDDPKIARGIVPIGPATWASLVIDRCGLQNREAILRMIDLVSCSKWADRRDEESPDWYYIPRYCDRLEAIGEIGVERCVEYSTALSRPFHSTTTVRVVNDEDLKQAVTTERYEAYGRGVRTQPETVIDHFYDKLLHIRLPEWCINPYLERMFDERQHHMKEWVFSYWRNLQI